MRKCANKEAPLGGNPCGSCPYRDQTARTALVWELGIRCSTSVGLAREGPSRKTGPPQDCTSFAQCGWRATVILSPHVIMLRSDHPTRWSMTSRKTLTTAATGSPSRRGSPVDRFALIRRIVEWARGEYFGSPTAGPERHFSRLLSKIEVTIRAQGVRGAIA